MAKPLAWYAIFTREKAGKWAHDISIEGYRDAKAECSALAWRFGKVAMQRIPEGMHEHEFIMSWLAQNNVENQKE